MKKTRAILTVFVTILIFVVAAMLFVDRSSKNLKFYEGSLPELDIQAYFTGPIKAWGLIHDWRGRVIQRFDVDMVGEWENGVGTLREVFRFYDGGTQERTWTIRKNSDGTYKGEASDIIGKAAGKSSGSAMNWKYSMDLPVSGSTYRINFDDWMWQMNDGVMINRAYLKKFGITAAELLLFMQKKTN